MSRTGESIETKQIGKGWEAGRKWGKIANGYSVSSRGSERVLKLIDSFTTLNILKTTERYTLNG